MQDPTRRFSTRVDNYVRFRPSYPRGVIETLVARHELRSSDLIADVGSGTGKLSRLFLAHGNSVVGIEPNREMREAGERELRDCAGFRSVNGRAEATTLPEASVDMVVAGQAFHWFDPSLARREFLRTLRGGARVVLVWNDRRGEASAFMSAYEQLLKDCGTDYEKVSRRWIDNRTLAGFFGAGGFDREVLPHRQVLDLDGLKGRLSSSSYIPDVDHPHHAAMMERVERLFETCRTDGRVVLEYDTKVYFGRLA